MKKKKFVALITGIIIVLAALIGIFMVVLYGDGNKPRQIKTEDKENTESETTEKTDSVPIYDGIQNNYYWYDAEGNILFPEDFLNMDISVEDKNIELCLDMRSASGREVKAYVMIFVGGVLHDFYVDGEEYSVYEYIQNMDFESKMINISIPIDNIEKAYDNTVRAVYMVCDVGIPPEGANRWYLASERIMQISDLKVQEFKGTNDVEYISLEGTDFEERYELYCYSEADFPNEKISIFDLEIPNKFYNYNLSTKNDKYISYMIVDDVIDTEGIFYYIPQGQLVRKAMEFDGKPHSIKTIVIPIGNHELGLEMTVGIYRVN